ncbi:MAG TPA: hypothetical protein VGC19_13350 [Rhodanobacter sp.]
MQRGAELVLVIEQHPLHAVKLVDAPFMGFRFVTQEMRLLRIEQRLKFVGHAIPPLRSHHLHRV